MVLCVLYRKYGANVNYNKTIKKIINDQECTWFLPKISKLDARKQWIIGSFLIMSRAI